MAERGERGGGGELQEGTSLHRYFRSGERNAAIVFVSVAGLNRCFVMVKRLFQ